MKNRENNLIATQFERLTPREIEILLMLAQGQSAPEIAEKLTLARSSVKWYIQQIYGKLGVNRKRQAIDRAESLGFLRTAPSASAGAPNPDRPGPLHNLVLPLTQFFGRELEITQLTHRIVEHRLVTLTGSGGVGKTRLSLQVAGKALHNFADGVWFVELAALTVPALVPQQVAAVLGAGENSGRPVLESLTQYVHNRQMLLVLDNCEHLLEACAQLAKTLLQAAAGLRIIASSREPLGVPGEAVYGVRSLPFPDPDHLPPLTKLSEYTAICLFVNRARLVRPDYHISGHNALPLARICQRLDGIPLAIEMAAARVNVLSAAHLAERLDDAFRVLTGGSRSAVPRQKTLRATIDWSYELLSDAERQLLQRLAVFAGGCTLEAAEVICADNVDAGLGPAVTRISPSEIFELLASLVSKSMLRADHIPGADTRYRLLETVRQYAREKLQLAGQGDRVRLQHLRFFLQLAQEAEPALRGPNQLTWLNRLEADLDNLRAAMDYSQIAKQPGEVEGGLRMAAALATFWSLRNHRQEAFAWLVAALSRRQVPGHSLVRAQGLHTAAVLLNGTAYLAWAQAAANESVEILRAAGPAGQRDLPYALLTQADLGHMRGYFASRVTVLNESIRLFQELGDKWGLAFALHQLAATLDPLVNYSPHSEAGSPTPLPELPRAARNDHTAEAALFEESLALFRDLGDRWGIARCLGSLGHLYFCWGENDRGQALFEEGIQIMRDFGNVEGVADYQMHLGRHAMNEDDLGRAATIFEEVLAVRYNFHDERGRATTVFLQAEVARRGGAYEQAAKGMAEAMAWYQKLGNGEYVAAVLDGQGRVARSQGDFEAAHRLHHEALTLRREAGHPVTLAHSFHALALVAALNSETKRAARLFGAAQPYHEALYGYWAALPIWRAEHKAAVDAIRTRLKEEPAANLWAEGEAMTLERAIACALAGPEAEKTLRQSPRGRRHA